MTAALDRVRRGTLTPAGPARLGLDFSSVPGGVTGQATCGPADEFGYCREQFHDATCGSYAGNDVALALIGEDLYLDRAASPWADANGRMWNNQYGLPMDLTQVMESVSGQRLANTRGDLFEDGHGQREAFRAQVSRVWADPDDPDGGWADEIPADVSGLASAVLAQAGIRTESAEAKRARLRADPRRQLMQAAIARQTGTTETMRERAERVREAAVQPDGGASLPNIYLSNSYWPPRGYRPPPSYGGLPGELPRFTWGDL